MIMLYRHFRKNKAVQSCTVASILTFNSAGAWDSFSLALPDCLRIGAYNL